MIVCGTISGFNGEDVKQFGFPIKHLELVVDGDLVLEDEDYDVMNNSDVMITLGDVDYLVKGNVIEFEARCLSLTLDSNDNLVDSDGDLCYAIVRNSYLSGIRLSSLVDNKQRMKVLGSLWFGIGIGSVHKRCNRLEIY